MKKIRDKSLQTLLVSARKKSCQSLKDFSAMEARSKCLRRNKSPRAKKV